MLNNSILTPGIGDLIQAYLLLSCCPCEGRISGIVDSPNAVTTLAIPTAIFDQVCLLFTVILPAQFSLVCLLLYSLNLLLFILTVH